MKVLNWKIFQLSEESFFRVSKFTLGYLGYWPENKVTPFEIFKIILHLSVLSYASVGELFYGFTNLHHLLLSLDALCPCITKVVTVFKLCILVVYRKQFTSIIQRTWKLWSSVTDPIKLKLMQRAHIIATICVLCLLIFGGCTGISFILRPIITNLISYVNGANFTKELSFKATFSYDIDTTTGYHITNTILSYSSIVTVFSFSGIDGLFFAFCLYISGLFDNIQVDIQQLISGKDAKFSPQRNEYVFNKLRLIIQKHEIVIELCEEFVGLYTVIILMHFVSAAIVICISSIDFMLSTGFVSLLYVNYTLAAMTQLFVYCFGGNYVYDSSVKIGESIYFSEWYKCDIRLQRMLAIIMMRAHRGTAVTVPFFTPSLPAFGTILSSAGSYITLLKTFL